MCPSCVAWALDVLPSYALFPTPPLALHLVRVPTRSGHDASIIGDRRLDPPVAMTPWCVAMGALFPNVAGAWDEPLRGTEACGSTTGRSGRSCGVPRERVNLMPRQPPRPVSRINPPEAAPGPISRRPLDSAFSLRTDNSPTLKASAPTRRQEAAQSGGDERGSTSSRRAIHGRDAGLCT